MGLPYGEGRGGGGSLRAPAVWGIGLVWVAVILGIHRESPYTLVSAHGLLHSAIAERFAIAPGVIPPENPFFAGEPLLYYWSYHALAAGLAELFGIDVLHAFEVWEALAAFALVVLAAGLGRRVHGRVGFGLLISFFIMAGAQAQAPLVLLWRRLRVGHWPADDGSYLWGLVHPVSAWMRLGDPFGQLGPLVSYYLNVTSRPLALTTLVGAVWALAWTREAPLRGYLALTGTVALLALWSPIIAIAAGLSLAGGTLVVEFARRRGTGGLTDEARLPWLAVGLAVLSGLAVAFPSYGHLLRGTGGEGSGLLGGGLDTARAHAGWALAAGWTIGLLAAAGVARAPRGRRALPTVCLVASLPLLAATVLIILPAGNFVNFFHAALVLLAVPAAGAFRDPRGHLRVRGVAAALTLFLPTLLLVLWTYTGRPPSRIVIRNGQLERADGPEARIYRWLREEAPSDAVVVIDPGPPTRAVQGNTAELPALTGRTLYTERAHHYIVSGHPHVQERVAIAKALTAGRPLTAEQEQSLRQLGRPIYILTPSPPTLSLWPHEKAEKGGDVPSVVSVEPPGEPSRTRDNENIGRNVPETPRDGFLTVFQVSGGGGRLGSPHPLEGSP